MKHRPDSRLEGILLAEAVRSLEETGIPLEGAANASAAACAQGGGFETRIINRACALPAAQPLRAALAHLRGATLLVAVGASTLAMAGGGGAAHALLTATAGGPVNVFLSLVTLLGLPVLTLLVWILLLALTSGRMAAGAIGRSVLAFAGRLARWLDSGPIQIAAVRAAARVLAESGAARWLAGALSHVLWLAYLVGVLAVLLLHFSTREYEFTWETTILAQRHYEAATQVLAVLPSWLGFAVPDATMVAESREPSDAVPAAVRQAWAGLLLGCIVVYGLAPRAVALLFSAVAARRAIGRIRLDTSHVGFARLRPVLMPVARPVGIVDPDRREDAALSMDAAEAPPVGAEGAVALLGLEIDQPRSDWPPHVPGIEWQDLGFVNDRTDRHRAVDRLAAAVPAPRAVLVVCALTLTPDRGHLAFLCDLKRAARVALVILLTGGQRLRDRGHPLTLATRIDDWRRLARKAGVPDERVLAVDLDHLTDESAERLARQLGGHAERVNEGVGAAAIGEAFDIIADHARRWPGAPDERQRLALQREIAALYRNRLRQWPSALGLKWTEGMPDAPTMSSAAERVVSLLPARLRISPRWLTAGALAGALGCLAAATLATPVALAALPAWSGLGAAVAAVLEQARGNEREAAADRAQDLGEPVAAAAMFALILHLQGREEATITDVLDRTLGEGDVPRLADAAAARAWLDALQRRLDEALDAVGSRP